MRQLTDGAGISEAFFRYQSIPGHMAMPLAQEGPLIPAEDTAARCPYRSQHDMPRSPMVDFAIISNIRERHYRQLIEIIHKPRRAIARARDFRGSYGRRSTASSDARYWRDGRYHEL